MVALKKTLILNLRWNLLKTIPTASWEVLTHVLNGRIYAG
jgi:hypothetical protein